MTHAMSKSWADRVEDLTAVWAIWAELGRGLDEAGWTTPTRCPGWDVAALVAHASMFTVALAGPAPAPPEGAGPDRLTAVDILRGFNAPDGVAHTMAGPMADAAVQDAAGHPRAELVARFAEAGPAAVAQLRTADPSTALPWPASGGITTLAEGVRIVVMESVVHLLDAQRALGRPPEVPGHALHDTVRLLAEVAPAVEFVEAATGRSASSPLPVLR